MIHVSDLFCFDIVEFRQEQQLHCKTCPYNQVVKSYLQPKTRTESVWIIILFSECVRLFTFLAWKFDPN